MIITLDWSIFHLKYFNQNTIFVKEEEDCWKFYTYEGIIIIKSVVEKKDEPAENMMFVERYLAGAQNVLKVMDITEETKVTIESEEEESEMIQVIESDDEKENE